LSTHFSQNLSQLDHKFHYDFLVLYADEVDEDAEVEADFMMISGYGKP
jgi:hypothetical protein